jgi:chromosome segregation protein
VAGQRLVSRQGDLWRWDGFVAAAQGAMAAASRLAERSRLGALAAQEAQSRQASENARAASEAATERHRTARPRNATCACCGAIPRPSWRKRATC